MSTGSGARPRVGMVSVPWVGIPPKSTSSSIPNVVDELTRRIADDCDVTVVAGPSGRDPDRAVPSIHYHGLDRRPDRLLDRLSREVARLTRSRKASIHRRSYHFFYALRAARICRQARCEVVFIHQFPQWIPIFRRLLPKAQILFWVHSGAEAWMPGIDRCLGKADGVVCCSEHLGDEYASGPARFTGPRHVVRNGYDEHVFFPDHDVVRRPTVLMVGRIAPEKGVHVLVDAFHALAGDRPDVELVLVGPSWSGDPGQLLDVEADILAELRRFRETDYEAELRRRAGEFVDRIRFTGPLDHSEIAELCRSCTAFALPSLVAEGFGLPAVEAMACGAAVVASGRGGVLELVDDGVNGLLVEVGDAPALADALASLLDHPERARELGARAHAHVRAGYTWDASAASLVEVIRYQLADERAR